MTVLSDATLRARIKAGELVVGGSDSQVMFCAYQFTPEKIFAPGVEGAVVDWKSPPADAHYVIAPGALVWMRVKGIVKMPVDLAAFYWQTNSLSRKGLMLVNSSLVEPGYEGPLACLFANFGREPVVVHPGTTVAKLIFLRLDADAAEPLRLTLSATKYDRDLKEVAVTAPASFLQVSELSKKLDRQLEEAVGTIKTAAATTREDEKRALTAARAAEEKELTENLDKRLRKAFVLAVLGLAIMSAGLTIASYVQRWIRPNIESEIRDQVQAEVRSRLATDAAGTAARRDSIDVAMQTELRELRRALDSVQKRLPSPARPR
jgi:deoxycytidine triphosphate deaminase